MVTITLIPPVVAPERQILDILRLAGFQELDGWFYPTGNPDRAVVRLRVGDGHYEIWRRRRLRSPWMRIVAAQTGEFDLTAFERWRQAWPLTS